MKTLMAICGLLLLLAACAPDSLQALREDAAAKHNFKAPLGYQEVYRRVVGPMRTCYQMGGTLGPQFLVQSDVFTDTRRGEVVLLVMTTLGTQYRFIVDIAAEGEDRASVMTYSWSIAHVPTGALVERWVLNQDSACGP